MNYRAFNKKTGAYASPVIPNVVDNVALTGVATTSGSNEITVASTTGVYPGMGLAISGVPRGAFVHAVKSATVIVAYAPVQNTTTGEWTVTAAGAYATATASSMLGYALGFNPVPVPDFITTGEAWRNTFSPTYKTASTDITIAGGTPVTTDYAAFLPLTGGYIVNPDTALTFADVGGTKKLVASGTSNLKMVVSDEFAVKPYRTKTKWVSLYHLVHTGGDVSTIPAHADIEIVRTGADS